MRSKSPDDLSRTILEKLGAAGADGLSAARLAKSGPPRSAALAALTKSRLIGNLGTLQKPKYVLIEHFKPLELAAAHISALATPGKAKAWTEKALTEGTKGAVKDQIGKAIEVLCKERELVPVKAGNGNYWLHAASLRPLLSPGSATTAEPPLPPAAPASESAGEDARIDAAYDRARQAEGFADVLISALWQESGLPLPELHELLVSRARQGRAVLSLGDYLLSPEEERAAALPLDGRHYLRVRLQKAETGN